MPCRARSIPHSTSFGAARAEDADFAFSLISDHCHSWIDRQGQSPFVWSVIGAIAATSSTVRIGTGVT